MRPLTRLEQRLLPGQVRHAERVLPALLPHIPPGATVLDFGKGSGVVAHTLEKNSRSRNCGREKLPAGA